jgi:hypothetical protein
VRPIAVAAAPCGDSTVHHCDLTVLGAQEQWTRIRWALFVFPDITDVAPTADPDVVRISYEGAGYADVWRVELLQAGFNVPEIEPPRPSRSLVATGSSASPRAAGSPPAPFPRRPSPSRLDRPRQRP